MLEALNLRSVAAGKQPGRSISACTPADRSRTAGPRTGLFTAECETAECGLRGAGSREEGRSGSRRSRSSVEGGTRLQAFTAVPPSLRETRGP